MANISWATQDMLSTNRSLSGFRPYAGKLNREDVATLVEVFEFVLSDVESSSIVAVLKNPQGYFLFKVSNDSNETFDFYEYINKWYTGSTVVSPVNAKLAFPRSLSKGIFSRYFANDSYDEDEEDDEPATGYMDADDISEFGGIEYYLKYDRTGEEVKFGDSPLRIGRSAKSADFVTKVSLNVSRPHCSIYLKDGKPCVMDEGSSNGTFINGKRVLAKKENIVKVGDVVVLADEKFEVKSR